YQYGYDLNKITYKDPDIYSGKLTKWAPTFDFGVYYYTKKFYAGACASHINQASLVLSDTVGAVKNKVVSHFIANVGYAYVINKQITLKPSMVIKSTLQVLPSVDLNMAVLIQEKLWIGLGARMSLMGKPLNSGIAMIEYAISKKFRMG